MSPVAMTMATSPAKTRPDRICVFSPLTAVSATIPASSARVPVSTWMKMLMECMRQLTPAGREGEEFSDERGYFPPKKHTLRFFIFQ